MNKEQTLKNRLVGWFSNPWVGFAGVLASILGVLVALYAIATSRMLPQLTYYIYPIKTVVVKAGQASSLKVLHREREISSDVTSVQVAVWNHGDKPIRSGDVLGPLKLMAEPEVQILEVKLLQQSREITQFTFFEEELDSGRVGLSWFILEQTDGALLQIVYSGSPQVLFKMSGTIIDQREILPAEPVGLVRYLDFLLPSKEGERTRSRYFAMGITFILGPIAFLMSFLLGRFPKTDPKQWDLVKVNLKRMLFLVIPFLVAGVYILIIAAKIPTPPF